MKARATSGHIVTSLIPVSADDVAIPEPEVDLQPEMDRLALGRLLKQSDWRNLRPVAFIFGSSF